MIIDGHSHACGRFLTADSIIKTLDSNGVDKVILTSGELNSKAEYSLPNIADLFPHRNVVKLTNYLTKFVMKLSGKVKDIPMGNKHVYDLTQKSNGRVIQFIWITTQINNPSDYLDKKRIEWDFKGVKLHQCWEKSSVDSDFFREVAQWAEKNSLPLFIHLSNDSEVAKIIGYKKNHPELKLIVAHLFGLAVFINKNFKDKNLYFDTSPFQLISKKRLIDAIHFAGADNIIFGTDTPYGEKIVSGKA
ncbi:MAG: amidohydrolase family protein [Bacteroidetes bacterium]|nr:amidohydrolase family protein [Bacteroidota bacterium]